MSLSMEKLNSLGFEKFIEVLGNVVEHCPIVLAGAWSKKPFANLDNLHDTICQAIDDLPPYIQDGVLRCHPDLAGSLATAGSLTSESKQEQHAAGLQDMTSEERHFLAVANDEYKIKFGFPFVICVRHNKKDAILTGIRKRLENTPEVEAKTGIEEVKKICYLRLGKIIQKKQSHCHL